MSIKWLRIAVFSALALVSSITTSAENSAHSDEIKSAEQLYTNQPPVTPELAFPGTYAVGVATITATDPKRLNTANFILNTERQLVLEVWYPAALPSRRERKLSHLQKCHPPAKSLRTSRRGLSRCAGTQRRQFSADPFIPWLYRLSHADVLSG